MDQSPAEPAYSSNSTRSTAHSPQLCKARVAAAFHPSQLSAQPLDTSSKQQAGHPQQADLQTHHRGTTKHPDSNSTRAAQAAQSIEHSCAKQTHRKQQQQHELHFTLTTALQSACRCCRSWLLPPPHHLREPVSAPAMQQHACIYDHAALSFLRQSSVECSRSCCNTPALVGVNVHGAQ